MYSLTKCIHEMNSTSWGEGTSEIQKLVIARNILKA